MRPAEPPPPCYYFAACGKLSELEKGGRSVCRNCAAKIKGRELPLKKNGWDAGPSPAELVWQLDMHERDRRTFTERLP